MITKPLFISLLCFLVISSCGGGTATPENLSDKFSLQNCSENAKKQFVIDVMEDAYFYAGSMPQVDIAAFNKLNDLVNALRVEPDRFTTIVDLQAYQNHFEESRYIGFGFKLHFQSDSSTYIVQYVYPGSPAALGGMRRGDRIILIDGVEISSFSDTSLLSGFLGELPQDQAIDFVVERNRELAPGEGTVEISLQMHKQNIDVNSVLESHVFTANETLSPIKVAYLHLIAFVENSAQGLAEFYRLATEEQAEAIVLDLRYNGGGFVSVAQQLASFIAGTRYANDVFVSYSYNQNNTQFDDDLALLNVNDSQGFERVYILTSEETCSSSELMINALRPYIDVVVIGGQTCGKPLGSEPIHFCEHVLLPIVFQATNADGFGDYFDGIAPNCPAKDDLTRDLGDPSEGMLRQVMHHLAHGTCLAAEEIVEKIDSRDSLRVNKY